MWLKADLSRDRLSFRENEGPTTFHIRGRARLVAIACSINSSALRWGENSIPPFRLYATPLTVGSSARYFAWFSCRMHIHGVVERAISFLFFFSNVSRKSIAKKNWTRRKKTFFFNFSTNILSLLFLYLLLRVHNTERALTTLIDLWLKINVVDTFVNSLFLWLICV